VLLGKTHKWTRNVKTAFDVLTTLTFDVSALVLAFATLGAVAPFLPRPSSFVGMAFSSFNSMNSLKVDAVVLSFALVSAVGTAWKLAPEVVRFAGVTAKAMLIKRYSSFTPNAAIYVERLRRSYEDGEFPAAKLMLQTVVMNALFLPIVEAALGGIENLYLARNTDTFLGRFVTSQVRVPGGVEEVADIGFTGTDAWMRALKRVAMGSGPPDLTAALSAAGPVSPLNVADMSSSSRDALAKLLLEIRSVKGAYQAYAGIAGAGAGAGAMGAMFGDNASPRAGAPVTAEERRIYKDLFVRRANPSRPFSVTMTRLVQLVLQAKEPR
jgi:hypothetical protein